MSGSSQSNNSSSKPQMTPTQMLDTYNQYLPSVMSTISGQIPAVTSSLAKAATAANPQYTASDLSQLNQYAPGYQQAGITAANTQAGATTSLLNGAGGQAAIAATNLARATNPDYYNVQDAASKQAGNLLNSYNMNGLSPGESNAVERSLNQSNTATGNLGLDNATNMVSNAMNFGSAYQAKQAALGTALGTASTVANTAQNTGFNPVTTALNAGNTSTNFGLGTFNPSQANSTLTAPLTLGTALGSQIAQNASSSKGSAAGSSLQGGIGCFLTTACCNYMGLPDNCEELEVLREFRRRLPMTLVKEYDRIAPAIVVKIQNNKDCLQYVYGIVCKCVIALKKCDSITALNLYYDMVNRLKGV